MRTQPKLKQFEYEPDEQFVSAYSRIGSDARVEFRAELRRDVAMQPSLERPRAVPAFLAITAAALLVLVGALFYFAGPIAAGGAAIAVALLAAWGNWIVKNTIDL